MLAQECVVSGIHVCRPGLPGNRCNFASFRRLKTLVRPCPVRYGTGHLPAVPWSLLLSRWPNCPPPWSAGTNSVGVVTNTGWRTTQVDAVTTFVGSPHPRALQCEHPQVRSDSAAWVLGQQGVASGGITQH